MTRQGKYTKRVTAFQKIKREIKRFIRWFWRLSWKKKLLYLGGPLLAFMIILPMATYLYFARDISDKERLMNRNNTGIVLLANDGKTEIYSSGRAKHREIVPLDQISDQLEHALIASEDKNFYEHGGFSVVSMLGAVYGNFVSGGASYGGSTLTQQLAKNTLLTSEKSYLRKFQELSVSVAIERTYSKDEILDMYLNSVYYGENAFGIADASEAYFGKTPADLNLAESAMLIGLLPAPSAYSPISGNKEYAKERQTTVLTRMVNNKYITEAEKNAALAEELALQPEKAAAENSIAPHYTEMVLNELYEKYGEEKVTRSGYQVTTTLDAATQKILQDGVTDNMPYIVRNGGSNASAIAIDPTSGEIRGLVGSANYNDETFGKVNMVTTPRQPGSSFKPIYYAQALADGVITPATKFNDAPIDIDGYSPQNASRTFSGQITVRNALSRSLNIPSVLVMQKLGVNTAVDTANRMGIDTIKKSNDYGLSLALGSAEAPLIEMTNAYAAFGNSGEQYDTTMVKSINSKYNDRVFAATETAKRVISEQGSYLISNILSDNTARSPIFGSSLSVAGKKVAVKTGTTDDSRDAWTIGYTPRMAVGVWVGNNDNRVMANGGSSMAGPIWRTSMTKLLANTPADDFAMVQGIVQKNVCLSNGGLADAAVAGKTYQEYFISSSLPTGNCSVKPAETKPAEKPKEEEPETDSPVETTTTVAASPPATAVPGTSVTFTATVSGLNAAGTVTFTDGTTTLASVPVNNGTAAYTTSTLTLGTHRIVASFAPTDTTKFDESTSPTMVYVVAVAPTTPTVPGNGSSQRPN